jgi:hypothetical protein
MDKLDPRGFFRNAATSVSAGFATSYNRTNEVEASFVLQEREAAIIAKGHQIIVKHCK